MFSFLNGIPQVTRNILILNVLMFLLTIFFEKQGIDLNMILGVHYVNSPLFEPYQIVSHFFMHQGFLHLFFNMLLLVMLGRYLEHEWGAKKFFIFYMACGLGSFALYNAIGVGSLMDLKHRIIEMNIDINSVNAYIKSGMIMNVPDNELGQALVTEYAHKSYGIASGASGAVFGVLVAFAILFPHVQFMIYFLFPIKAWVLAILYVGYELMNALQPAVGDNVGHLAHLGGAITGAIIAYFWKGNRYRTY